MSWEVEKDLDRKRPSMNRGSGSPLMLLGFVMGVLAASPFASYWVYAWVIPLLLAGLLATVAAFAGRHARRVLYVAEGALAATVFAVVFVLVALVGVLLLNH